MQEFRFLIDIIKYLLQSPKLTQHINNAKPPSKHSEICGTDKRAALMYRQKLSKNIANRLVVLIRFFPVQIFQFWFSKLLNIRRCLQDRMVDGRSPQFPLHCRSIRLYKIIRPIAEPVFNRHIQVRIQNGIACKMLCPVYPLNNIKFNFSEHRIFYAQGFGRMEYFQPGVIKHKRINQGPPALMII